MRKRKFDMNDVLNDAEVKRLGELGERISICLDLELTDLSGIGIPCRSDRLAGVQLMKEYLEIHGFKVDRAKEGV